MKKEERKKRERETGILQFDCLHLRAALIKYHSNGLNTHIYFTLFWRLEFCDQGAYMVRF